MKQVLQMAWQKALGVVVLCGLAVLTMTAQAKFDPNLLIGQWWCKAESKTRQSDAFITYDQNGNSQTDEVGACVLMARLLFFAIKERANGR